MEKTFKKYIGYEKNLQISIAYFLNHLGILWFHCPNEIRAKPQYMKQRKKMGVLAGVSDCIILEPRGKYHGLAIELKVKGGKVSELQKTFLERAKKRGYKTAVCWGIDETEYIVLEYLKQNKPPVSERQD